MLERIKTLRKENRQFTLQEEGEFRANKEFLFQTGAVEILESIKGESLGEKPEDAFMHLFVDEKLSAGEGRIDLRCGAYLETKKFPEQHDFSPTDLRRTSHWKKLSVLADAKRREITVVGLNTRTLDKSQWSDSNVLEQAILLAVAFPAQKKESYMERDD